MISPERRIAILQSEISKLRQRIVDLITQFQADCLSCRHYGGGACMTCPVKMKSNYAPVIEGYEDNAD